MSFKKIIFIKCILFLNISLAYAEFEIVEKSEIEVEVNNNYFKGTHFLVEGNFRNNLIYFLSDKKLNKKQKVFLSLNSNF